MARLWSSGFELNSTTSNLEIYSPGGSPTIQTTTVHSGTYALQITSLSSGTRKHVGFPWNGSAQNGPYYIRFYFRYDTAPSGDNTIFRLGSNPNLTIGDNVFIELTNGGTLILSDEDGDIGSPSSALSTGTWYRIEVEVDRTAAAGSHIVRARIDGSEFAGSSARDLAAGFWGGQIGGNIQAEAQTTGNWYFDDIAINDSTGSFQNSYPGEGEIIHLRPNAAGDNAGWAAGTGSTFAEVDEVTPDTGTYIASTTSGDISDFNIDDTPAALASDDTINCVMVGVRYAESVTTDPDPTFKIRIKASSGGTVEESSDITANATAFGTYPSSIYRYQLVIYDLPGASTTAWTKTDLDAAQIGVNLTNDPAGDARVSALWLLVEHKPAEGGGTTTSTSTTTSTTTSTSSSTSTSTTSTSTSTSTTSSTTTSTTITGTTTSTSSTTSTTTSSSTSTTTSTTTTSTSTSTSSTTSTSSSTTTSTTTSVTTSTTTSTSSSTTTSVTTSTTTSTSSSTTTTTTGTTTSTSTTTSTTTSTSTTTTLPQTLRKISFGSITVKPSFYIRRKH